MITNMSSTVTFVRDFCPVITSARTPLKTGKSLLPHHLNQSLSLLDRSKAKNNRDKLSCSD